MLGFAAKILTILFAFFGYKKAKEEQSTAEALKEKKADLKVAEGINERGEDYEGKVLTEWEKLHKK